jgi:2,4-dienoyl-CoA reductase-like NADH-dependent reductase (Old Yellow Enzyme family)
MSVQKLFEPLSLTRGPGWKNRLALAPLTNQQSHADGRLSEEEFRWLTMRAQGGFALTMTCASHVQKVGQGFPGQLGSFGDEHLEGLTRLASAIRAAGSVSAVQLHHAGFRAPKDLVGEPVGPSDDAESGARGLSVAEVEQLRDDFIAGALRAQQAGFDGVEVHGAHGYVLCSFLSPTLNRRDDIYGGSLENRARLLIEVVDGIRAACRPDFQVGVRLSPERYGMELAEVRDVAQQIFDGGKIDYLDMSLWDVRKAPNDEAFAGQSLTSVFTGLDRGSARLGVAGKIGSAETAAWCLEAGADFATIGRAAILAHDFPRRVAADPTYNQPDPPIAPAHLSAEGVGPAFMDYLRSWPGFVGEAA